MQEHISNKVIQSLGTELANQYINNGVIRASLESELEQTLHELETVKRVLHSDETLLALYHEQKEKLESEQHDVQDK